MRWYFDRSAVAILYGTPSGLYLEIPKLGKTFSSEGVDEMKVMASAPIVGTFHYVDSKVLYQSLHTAPKFIDGVYSIAFYERGSLNSVASVSRVISDDGCTSANHLCHTG
ncbi:hypothetical protein AG1IA_03891 [Rhizoctonia solani AG-1 IA]|uniref:Uncharacterized protein n=1 Tax=Thanatephorus cucumeris (strain AG1-IA) TaxID=983506 RepID=L8WZ64_THACA|nr:hypothetical protein AG1IA_03891 [Rhizoctonia solani AG-1 IA]